MTCSSPQLTYLLPFQDRENVDVVAHELAHSWSGNLVSNASWEHFWLNEGWTVYLERRVLLCSFSGIISMVTYHSRYWLKCGL